MPAQRQTPKSDPGMPRPISSSHTSSLSLAVLVCSHKPSKEAHKFTKSHHVVFMGPSSFAIRLNSPVSLQRTCVSPQRCCPGHQSSRSGLGAWFAHFPWGHGSNKLQGISGISVSPIASHLLPHLSQAAEPRPPKPKGARAVSRARLSATARASWAVG